MHLSSPQSTLERKYNWPINEILYTANAGKCTKWSEKKNVYGLLILAVLS